MSFVFPVVFGHRGAKAVEIENTIEAFRYACQSGVRWVELDAMLSKDKQPVVFHDETLDRLSGVHARLDQLTLKELKEVSLINDRRIPTLDEVLDCLNGYDGGVNIEIKPSCRQAERETAQKVWQVVRQKGFDDPKRVFFSSFAWDSLEEIGKIVPHIKRGLLLEDLRPDWRFFARKIQAYSINCDARLLTVSLINEIKKAGYRLMAYTVNDPAQAVYLYRHGVDGFFCDDPVSMIEVLKNVQRL